MQAPVPVKTETTDDLLPSEEKTTQDANLFNHLDYLSNLYRQTMHIRDLDQLEDLRNNDDSKYTLSFIDAAAESRAQKQAENPEPQTRVNRFQRGGGPAKKDNSN